MLKITLNILQNPRVICNDEEISFPVRRADALLYYMVCQRTATRKELVSLLWDSCDNETGHKNLRNTLYTLKKSLGQDVLVSPRKTTLQFHPDVEIDCDYTRFMEQGDYEAYKGTFLQGFSLRNAILFEEWVDRMREKTREQYLRYLLRLAHEAAERGEIKQAEQYALEYMNNDALDEQTAIFLMQLYRNNKMYPKVTRVYQKLRECLEEELGIAPLAETTALYYEVMNEWNDTATGDDGIIADDYLPPSRAEIISRMNNELRLFLSRTGKHTSFLLRGEAGMGKTFLLESFLGRTDLADVLVLKGNCYQSETHTAYKPWNSVMIAIAGYMYNHNLSLPDSVRHTIAETFPIFASGKSGEAAHQCGEKASDNAISECILLLISMLTKHTQIVLVFEDILWMDAGSMNLLDALLRYTGPGQLIVIVTSRDILPPHTDASLRSLVEDKLLHTINLERLTCEDVRVMTQMKLGLELPAQVVQRIHDETGGNPSLLYELMSGDTDYSSVESLLLQSRHLLDRRLIGLSVSARQLLDIIALFPGVAPCNMLASIYSKGPDELLAASEELKQRSLVLEQQMEQGESALTIIYTRLQALIYQQQSYFKRRPLHLRIARLLAQQDGELTIGLCERLSYHFTQANDSLNAVVYDSARLLLLAELRCGSLPVLPKGKDTTDSTEGETPNTSALRELEAKVGALRHKLGKSDQLTEAENKLLLAKALIAFSSGDSDCGLAALAQLTNQNMPEADNKLLTAYRLLALYYQNKYDLEQMDAYLSLGSNLSDKSGDELASIYFCLLRGQKHSLASKYDKSNYFLNEALDRFQALREAPRYRLQIAGVYHALGLNEHRQGDISAACAYYKQAVAEAADCGAFKGLAPIYADYGRAALSIGDNNKARGLFHTAFALAEKAADLPAIAVAGAYLALFAADDFEAAATYLAQARKAANQAGTPLEQGIVYSVIAQLRQKLDMERKQGNALDKLLNRPLDVYCRKGLSFLEKTLAAYEHKILTDCLRYSTTKSRPFTVPELYSKNKQFMTE